MFHCQHPPKGILSPPPPEVPLTGTTPGRHQMAGVESATCLNHQRHTIGLKLCRSGAGWEERYILSSFKDHKKHFHFIQMHFIILPAREDI